MAANPQSESAGSEQTGMDYNAATPTEQATGTPSSSSDHTGSTDSLRDGQGNAQTPSEHPFRTPSSFGQVDRNGDGYISRDEVGDDRTLQDRWDTIDKNNDQRIDRSEFSALENRSGG